MSNITPNSQSSPHPFLDAPPPRASFSSLPQELQSLICRMASEQDKAYWERLDKATPPELEAFALLPKCEATGKSLGMLSRVNKEVNALCAPLLFRELTASRASSAVCRFVVLPRRRDNFVHLNLDDKATAADLNTVLAAGAPRIVSLKLSYPALVEIHGSMDPEDCFALNNGEEDMAFRSEAFWSLAGSITHLELDDSFFGADHLSFVFILRRFIKLVSLKLPLRTDNQCAEDLAVLLAGSTTLQRLHVSVDDGFDDRVPEVPDAWTTLDWASSSSLRHLTLKISCMSQRTWEWINKFHGLLTLNFTFESYRTTTDPMDEERPTVDFSITNFPRLHTLRLRSHPEDSCTFLKSLHSTPLSISLRSLTMSWLSAPTAINVTSILEGFQLLRKASYELINPDGNHIHLSGSSFNLIKLCADRSIRLD